jgi:hypothetical protein
MSNTSFFGSAGTFFLKVSRAFFSLEADDTVSKAGYKVAKLTTQRIVYSLADYWLMVLAGVFIVLMDKQYGYEPLVLFLLMWAFDIVVANTFVLIWQRTGEDVTLGESYRRAADVIHSGNKYAGYLAFAMVVLKASFWDGPEHIVIFFHKELKTEFRMSIIILGLTAVQAAIWTPIYILGFETISQLISYLM